MCRPCFRYTDHEILYVCTLQKPAMTKTVNTDDVRPGPGETVLPALFREREFGRGCYFRGGKASPLKSYLKKDLDEQRKESLKLQGKVPRMDGGQGSTDRNCGQLGVWYGQS